MDYTILEDIKNCTNLKEYIDDMVEYRSQEARLVNEDDCDFLGFNFENIPSDIFTINYSWYGFIDKNIKITYGISKENNICSDDGMYFYIDSNDYLYEFIEYIKDKKIISETQFILLVFNFINNYFERNDLNIGNHRNRMYQYLYKSKDSIYKPFNKHSITDFKKQGNAMCVERSCVAQNIFSFFGLESAVIYGTFSKSNDNEETIHAFNVISFNNQDYLLDINCMVRSYKINSCENTLYPFTDTLTPDLMQKANSSEEIFFDDYFMVNINNNNYYYNNGLKRKYVFRKCKNIEYVSNYEGNIK